jgi:hypothetical protein
MLLINCRKPVKGDGFLHHGQVGIGSTFPSEYAVKCLVLQRDLSDDHVACKQTIERENVTSALVREIFGLSRNWHNMMNANEYEERDFTNLRGERQTPVPCASHRAAGICKL